MLASFTKEAGSFLNAAFAVAAERLADERADLMIGTTIGHYKVLKLLGTGGMGGWRAKDTRLNREVAIKLLPRRLPMTLTACVASSRKRATSTLNHPNILTIYDIGTTSAETGGALHRRGTARGRGNCAPNSVMGRCRYDGRRVRATDRPGTRRRARERHRAAI